MEEYIKRNEQPNPYFFSYQLIYILLAFKLNMGVCFKVSVLQDDLVFVSKLVWQVSKYLTKAFKIVYR